MSLLHAATHGYTIALNYERNDLKTIVCIGGGTGLSTLLRGLKHYCDPTAIVTMADSGGHSGRLRDELGMLPPGDVRSCLVALADDAKATLVRDLFNYRFINGIQTGASMGNLLLAALADMFGDFDKAVAAAHELLGLRGQVIPVALEPVDLLAELEDGTILFGEKTIDLPRENGHVKIKRVWLQPKVEANERALEAIATADAIVFGPGDLYTSLIPNIYVSGMAEAIQRSHAPLIFISNIMTKHGETDGYTVEDFLRVLNTEIGRTMDYVLYNNQPVPAELLTRYKEEKAEQVVAIAPLQSWVGAPVPPVAGELARHDSEKLAKALYEIVENKTTSQRKV